MAGRAVSASLPFAALGIALIVPLGACNGRGGDDGGPLEDTSVDIADAGDAGGDTADAGDTGDTAEDSADTGDAGDTAGDTVDDTEPSDTGPGDADADTAPGVSRAILTTSGSAGLMSSSTYRAFVGVGAPQPMGTVHGATHVLTTGPGAARP